MLSIARQAQCPCRRNVMAVRAGLATALSRQPATGGPFRSLPTASPCVISASTSAPASATRVMAASGHGHSLNRSGRVSCPTALPVPCHRLRRGMASSTTIQDSTGGAVQEGSERPGGDGGGVDVHVADGWEGTPEVLLGNPGFLERFEYDGAAVGDPLTTDEENASETSYEGTSIDDNDHHDHDGDEVDQPAEATELDPQGQDEATTSQQLKDPSVMRLSRRIARSGVASRREAERLVEEGVVTVNGSLVQTPALNVGPEDIVKVKGKALERQEEHTPKLWMVHKTRNELVTRDDPQGRTTVFDRLAKLKMPDTLMPVGRLDYNTEGLLLLTNDGDLARLMELPSSNIVRTYSVRVYGNITEEKLRAMRSGCTIDGVRYKGMFVRVEGGGGKGREGRNAWLTIECTEGKNRQIRKICKYLCLTVNRLARIRYGPFSLGKVRSGGVARVEIPKAFMRRLEEGTAAGVPGGGGRRREGPGPGKGMRREAEAGGGRVAPYQSGGSVGGSDSAGGWRTGGDWGAGGGRGDGDRGGFGRSSGAGDGSRSAGGGRGGTWGKKAARIRKGVGAPMSRGDNSARSRPQQRAR
ncbi:unnamed protein product [Scytosiphon promiscuus]